MSSSVGSIHYDLKLQTAQFDAASASIHGKLSSLKSSMNDTSGSATDMGDKGGGGFMSFAGKAAIAAAAVLGIGYAIKATVGPMISIGMEAQNLRTNLDVLTGSAESGAKMYKQLVDFAAKTPFESTELVAASTQMLSFGIAQDKIMPNLQALGDVAMGNKEKLSGLTYAFSQVQSTGRLMGQDLLQMINNGFNPLEQISRTTGKSMKDLKKDMENGAISADMVSQAFQDATGPGGRFFEGMDKGSKTLSGRMSTLRDNSKTAIRAAIGIDESGNVKEGGIFDTISKSVEKLFPIMESLAKNIGPAVTNFFKGLGDVFNALKPVFAILGAMFKEVVEQVTKFWKENQNWLIPVLKVVAGILGGALLVSLGIIIGILWLGFAAFNALRAAIIWAGEAIANIIIWFANMISTIVNFFADAPTKLYEAGKSLIEGFLRGVVEIGNTIGNTISNVMSAIGRFMAGAWNWLYGHGRALIEGFARGIAEMGGSIWNAIAGVSATIGNFFSGAWNWLYSTGKAIVQGLVNGLGSMLGEVQNKAAEIANTVKNAIADKLKIRSPSRVMYEMGTNITQGMTDGISAGLNQVQAMTNNMGSTIISGQNQSPRMQPINIYGNIEIGDRQTADYFFNRLNRGQDLSSMGLGG
jgi:tape measure domain-containing protein